MCSFADTNSRSILFRGKGELSGAGALERATDDTATECPAMSPLSVPQRVDWLLRRVFFGAVLLLAGPFVGIAQSVQLRSSSLNKRETARVACSWSENAICGLGHQEEEARCG